MARAALTVNQIIRTGTGLTTPAETNGDATNHHKVVNDGKLFLLVRNSNGASTARVVTIYVNGQIDGQAVTPKTVSIPAGESRYLGPFPTNTYGKSLLIDVAHAELKLTAFHL